MDWLRKLFRKPEPTTPEPGANTALTLEEFWDLHPEAKPRVTPGLDVRHDLYIPPSQADSRAGLACDIGIGQWMRYLKQGSGPWFSWRWLTRHPEDAGYRDTAPDVRSVEPAESVTTNQAITDYAWEDRTGYGTGRFAV